MKSPHSNTPGFKALIILLTILLFQTAASAVYAQNAPPAVKDPGTQGPPPTVLQLEVADPMFSSRYGMEGFLRGLDSEFVFKQGPNVNGQEEFSATDSHNTSVEIIGSERDMQTVKWTIGFNANHDVNMKEIYRLANFLMDVGGKEAVQWFYDQTPKNLAGHPQDDYTETKAFEGRNIRFEYRPKLRQASMTVFMKK